jgi:nicotinamide-nucleotide amidase
MFPTGLLDHAANLLTAFRSASMTIATAESCTGGLLAGLLTEIPGSSDVFERGWVTYSNEAKVAEIGVPAALIARRGAVSAEVAAAMAAGALARSGASVALAITGIAGPGGGTPDKPVGLVHFGLACATEIRQEERRFGAIPRAAIRLASLEVALRLLGGALPGQI